MSEQTAPRHARFFSAARPFDATKDDCLLDAIQQSIELAQDCEMQLGFFIRAHRGKDGAWDVEVERPGGDVFYGATVREALSSAMNAE